MFFFLCTAHHGILHLLSMSFRPLRSTRLFMPGMNGVLRGSRGWSAAGFAKAGIVSGHQGHQSESELTDDDRATGIWAMSDRLFMPAGMPCSLMTGYGHYHETYEKSDGMWKIKTLRFLVGLEIGRAHV